MNPMQCANKPRAARCGRSAMSDAADFAGIVTPIQVALPGEKSAEQEAYDFLATVFQQKPDTAFVLIWSLPSKTSFWFRDLRAAARKVTELAGENVYVGVALSPSDFGPKNRCKAEDTLGIVGAWCDIDVSGEAHKTKNLPPTLEEALSLIPTDLPPTVLVQSGHGLQGWWLFKEPWIFEDRDQRHAAVQLVGQLDALLKKRAAAHNWAIDSVWDPARVLRVPGSTNRKPDCAPCPVTILRKNDRRYDPSELKEYFDEAAAFAPKRTRKEATTATPATGFVLNPKASPPIELFDLLKENEPRFGLAWEHRRADMKDQSASSYDMSLAIYAARARWTDQEIIDLLIAHRRKYGLDLKLRESYYGPTLDKAKEDAKEYWAELKADEILSGTGEANPDVSGEPDPEPTDAALPPGPPFRGADPEAPAGSELPEQEVQVGAAARVTPGEQQSAKVLILCPNPTGDSRRAAILDALSTKFKIRIRRLIKFTGDPGQYRMETAKGAVQLGQVDGLIAQSKLRKSLADATGRYLPNFDKDDWPLVAQSLLDACEEVDRGEDATLKGTLTEHMRAYLGERPPHKTLKDADEGREPFEAAGGIYIFIDNFQSWLKIRRGEQFGRNRLTADLRAYGATPEKYSIAADGRETSRSVWRLPPGPWDDDERE